MRTHRQHCGVEYHNSLKTDLATFAANTLPLAHDPVGIMDVRGKRWWHRDCPKCGQSPVMRLPDDADITPFIEVAHAA